MAPFSQIQLRRFSLNPRMQCLLSAAGLFAIAASLLCWGYYKSVERWKDNSLVLAEPREIVLEQRTGLTSFSRKLKQIGLVDNSFRFRIFVRLFADYSRFQAGRYRFTATVSPAQLAQVITSGQIYTPIALQFTIPEGFSIPKIAQRLQEKGVGSAAEIAQLASDPGFLSSRHIPSRSAEGYLYPATYSFPVRPTPHAALSRMVQQFWSSLPKDYSEKVAALGLTLNEAVTFASLIEVETSHPDEKHMIAEVIWKRLKLRMPLGIDAAIIYGIKDYAGDLTFRHLRDSANPYNTRVRLGLPPTAVCSPTVDSLLAVLTPTQAGYLYYVLDPELGNRHHFSRNFSEHQNYARKLVKAEKAAQR